MKELGVALFGKVIDRLRRNLSAKLHLASDCGVTYERRSEASEANATIARVIRNQVRVGCANEDHSNRPLTELMQLRTANRRECTRISGRGDQVS